MKPEEMRDKLSIDPEIKWLDKWLDDYYRNYYFDGNTIYGKTPRQQIVEIFISKFSDLQQKIKTDIMGTLVKNSTGFDTLGNKRIWYVDLDAFEADVLTLFKQ